MANSPKAVHSAAHRITPSSVTLVLNPADPLSPALREVAEVFFDAWQTTFCTHLDEATSNSTDMILLPLRDPVDLLARELGTGKAPSAALAAWQATAVEIVRQTRRLRRRLVVVDAHLMIAGDDACRAEIAHRLGAEIGSAYPVVKTTEIEALPPPDDLLTAWALFQLDPDTGALADELNVLRTTPSSVSMDLKAVDASFAARIALAAERSALERERDLLRESIDLQMRATEETQKQNVEAQKQIKALENKLAANEKTIHASTKTHDASLAKAKEEAEKAVARSVALQAELEAIYASKSWTITAPIRTARRMLTLALRHEQPS